MADVRKIGFIGLGWMGQGMASNLMQAGHALPDTRDLPFHNHESIT
ncbi:NAD(P)-binding domain-containing protein [Yoonia sp.]